MSNPINRSPSGIIFFGKNGPEAVLQSRSNFVYDTGNGFVGINKANPSYNLDVSGTGAFTAVRFNDGTVQTTAYTGNVPSSGSSSSYSKIAGRVTTAAATAAKQVSISGYTLSSGDLLAITFASGNSVANATLSVNSGTAYNIRLNSANVNTTTFTLTTGALTLLYFDNSYFHVMGSQRTTDSDTTYTEITEAEILAGTASTARSYSGRRALYQAQFVSPTGFSTGIMYPVITTGTGVMSRVYLDTGISFNLSGNYLGVNTNNPTEHLDVRGKAYAHSYYTRLANSGNVASSVVLNMDDSNLHQLTLSGASINISVTGIDVGQRFIIRAKQDNVGSRSINWFSGIKWPGGTAPTLSTRTGVADLIGFIVTSISPPTYDGFMIVTGIY